MLDDVQSIIQLAEGFGVAIWIGLFAFREANIEVLMQRAPEEGSWDVKDGNLKVMLGMKGQRQAESWPNQ